MSLIAELKDILEAGRIEYEKEGAADFRVKEEIRPVRGVEGAGSPEQAWRNRLGWGDNGAYMKWLLSSQDMAGKIRMVYIDPPFFSKASYEAVIPVPGGQEGEKRMVRQLAYEDVWKQGIAEYLTMLASRLFLIRDLLTEDGTVWVHLDWHAVHYVRVLMDEIFGADHFVNEIIWTYKSGGSTKKHFARKHDTILVYSKGNAYFFQPLQEKSYNRGLKPYRFQGVEEFQDEVGWYTMVNMKDVWQIDMVGRTSAERTGYATQKPEALLQRIIACSTEPGDLCADFFCGSGSLAAAAQKMGRRWICCDIGSLAVSGTMKRILKAWDGIGGSAAGNLNGTEDGLGNGLILDTETDREPAVLSPGEGCGTLEAGLDLRIVTEQEGQYLELLGYHISSERLKMLDPKDVQVLQQTAEKESLRLIDYWMADFHYDGKTHRTEQIFLRGKDGLQLRCNVPGTEDGRPVISIMAADILGNRVQRLL